MIYKKIIYSRFCSRNRRRALTDWCLCMSSSRTVIKKWILKISWGSRGFQRPGLFRTSRYVFAPFYILKTHQHCSAVKLGSLTWVSRKWLNFLFWVKYPFNMDLLFCIFKPSWKKKNKKNHTHKLKNCRETKQPLTLKNFSLSNSSPG